VENAFIPVVKHQLRPTTLPHLPLLRLPQTAGQRHLGYRQGTSSSKESQVINRGVHWQGKLWET
jgi:hypothetical protein